MVCGTWVWVRGMWYVVRDMWYVVHGTWYVVCDMWYVIRGTWYGDLTSAMISHFLPDSVKITATNIKDFYGNGALFKLANSYLQAFSHDPTYLFWL